MTRSERITHFAKLIWHPRPRMHTYYAVGHIGHGGDIRFALAAHDFAHALTEALHMHSLRALEVSIYRDDRAEPVAMIGADR